MSNNKQSRVQSNRRALNIVRHVAPQDASSSLELSRPDFTQIVTAEQAAQLIPSNATIALSGFVACGCAESILDAIRARFDKTASPNGLTLVWGISSGNKKGRGFGVLAKDGLTKRLIYAWTASAPEVIEMVKADKCEAYNLPLGVITHLVRAIGQQQPGLATKVGLNTFADPRDKGGRLTSKTTEQLSTVMKHPTTGEDMLFFPSFPVHVSILRATMADTEGNLGFQEEPVFYNALNEAMAARNSGGIVIAQVSVLVDAKTIPAREVHIPGSMVDYVVVTPTQEFTLSPGSDRHDCTLSGNRRAPASAVEPITEVVKKVMAHRAVMEIPKPSAVVNLGVGLPENVAVVAATHTATNPHAASANLTAEAGTIGGQPMGGLLFGTARNAEWIAPSASLLDFYQGGGIDMTVLGLGEADQYGNVNVSNFTGGDKTVMPGCGGFVDISGNSKKVVFMGTLTVGGLKAKWTGNKLVIEQEGRIKKFKTLVSEKTFAGKSANGRTVLFVTERAVFRIPPNSPEGGLELIEVAPGIDVKTQVLAQMDCVPLVSAKLKTMDPMLFEL